MKTISVIIPAYNAEPTIADTIQSVLSQTFLDFEIIVINDGSTDRTLEIVKEIPDERIKLFSYENGGIATARNRGLNQSQGEFIAFLDADDLWTPDKLASQHEALISQTEAGAAYSWTLVMDDETGRLNAGTTESCSGNVYSQLFHGNFIASGSNLMMRRSVIESVGLFSLDVPGVEDWEYWLRISREFEFVNVRKFQVLYRQTSDTVSSNIGIMKHSLLKVHEQEFEFSPQRLQPIKARSLAYVYSYIAKLYRDRVPGWSGFIKSGKEIGAAILISPHILLENSTQRFIIKWLLTGFLPYPLSKALFQYISQARAIEPNPPALSKA